MRFIKLSANKHSFHTITFKSGLNLIVGKKNNPNDNDPRNTYNGVGKSLIVYLIHFCLASNQMKVFEDKIPGWEFSLEFELNGEIYLTHRNTSSQKDIFLNGKKHTLSAFRRKLLKEVFATEDGHKNLTFNTLFPRFIRRDRECYSKYDTFVKKEQDYSKLINNAFLLGIDIDLIEKKKALRDIQKNTEDLKKGLEKDPVLKEHFSKQEDTEIELLDLEEDIKLLESELENFKVASNYHDIEKEADETSYLIKKLENKRVIVSNSLRNIEKSLQIEPDVSNDKVIKLYEQAKIQIPEMVRRKVEEVVEFHNNLILRRKQRLFQELKSNREKLKSINNEISETGKTLDQLLSYLDTHGALDEYTSLNKKISDLKIRKKRLDEYHNIIKSYKKKLRDIQTEYAEQNKESEEYLDSIESLLEKIMVTFRDLSKTFYDKKPGGIRITNNEGENTQRFEISAKIQDDSSDGVNEVKIFCFDMTLLLLQLNHKMKFLFHDSRLFSNMDPRQRYTLFKIAYQKTQNSNFQYIATVNEDTLESFRDLMTTEEYEMIIEQNIILTLTDESEKSKLLGIQIDMEYQGEG